VKILGAGQLDKSERRGGEAMSFKGTWKLETKPAAEETLKVQGGN